MAVIQEELNFRLFFAIRKELTLETKTLKKYAIKKGKTDLKSSLKALNKKILKENGYDSVDEAYDSIKDEFETILEISKDDIMTIMYFSHILECENTPVFAIYQEDVESLWAFVYDAGGYYSYYIPDEIKKIILKVLK